VPEILLSRQEGPPPSDDDKAAVRRVIFGIIHGLGDTNRKAWARFWNGVLRLEPGEVVEIRTHRERIGWYHRKHMAMEQRIFDEQERFEHFEQFRNWIKIGAGHVDWVPGPRGAVVPIPRSISYAKMDQGEMEAFHDAAVAFLREPHAAKVLWPKLPAQRREGAIEALLASFEE
jgi:hypothetical protein